jgi:hypothetical protein
MPQGLVHILNYCDCDYYGGTLQFDSGNCDIGYGSILPNRSCVRDFLIYLFRSLIRLHSTSTTVVAYTAVTIVSPSGIVQLNGNRAGWISNSVNVYGQLSLTTDQSEALEVVLLEGPSTLDNSGIYLFAPKYRISEPVCFANSNCCLLQSPGWNATCGNICRCCSCNLLTGICRFGELPVRICPSTIDSPDIMATLLQAC